MENQKIDIHVRGSKENENHKFLYDKITHRDKNRYYYAIDYLAEAVRAMEKSEHILCFNVADLAEEDYQTILMIMNKTRGENEHLSFR